MFQEETNKKLITNFLTSREVVEFFISLTNQIISPIVEDNKKVRCCVDAGNQGKLI